MYQRKKHEMPWLHLSFKKYAHDKGALVQKVDLTHLSIVLTGLPEDKIKAIAKEYVEVWLKTMRETPGIDLHKIGCARRAANLWVRKEAENIASLETNF